MINKMFILVSVICVVILVSVFLALRVPQLNIASHLSVNEKLNALDEWLELIHAKEKFNGSVLLSKKGQVVFSKSYGLDTAESPGQLTEHSSFNLASVSKQFTAMGIVILNQQSKLKFQDKLSDHIPELSFYKDITILHLLHHTSGLPDYMHLAEKNRSDSDVFTTSEMISLYNKNTPKLNFKSGSKFQYSNAGYVLLAEIIARVSGISFQDFMAKHIFKPLKMNDSQVFNLLSAAAPAKRVYGYKHKYWLFGGKKLASDLNHFDGVTGDGAVYSSAYDLNLWHTALRDSLLVPHEVYKEAYLPAQLEDGSKTKYGFGWFINKDNSIEHAGGWQGFTSFIYRNIEKDDLIVILDNSSNTLRVNSIGFRFNSIGLNLKDLIATL